MISLHGTPTYLHGCNMAWLAYGQDFGGGASNAGATQNRDQVDYWFAAMQSAGMNSVRWIMWPYPGQWLLKDVSGMPSDISPSVWPDLDLVLDLAWRRGLQLDLCIFDHPEDLPQSWIDTSGGRTALVKALGKMLTRYAGHPNILAWELGNEWDNRMYADATTVPRVSPQNAKFLIAAFVAKVHACGQLATMSNGGANLLAMFRGLGLDFYQVHWYDKASPVRTDDYNLGLHPAAYYKLDKPVVVGEFLADVLPGPTGQLALDKYRSFAHNGYAGAWGWSASPAAADNLRIDWAAATRFALETSSTRS